MVFNGTTFPSVIYVLLVMFISFGCLSAETSSPKRVSSIIFSLILFLLSSGFVIFLFSWICDCLWLMWLGFLLFGLRCTLGMPLMCLIYCLKGWSTKSLCIYQCCSVAFFFPYSMLQCCWTNKNINWVLFCFIGKSRIGNINWLFN